MRSGNTFGGSGGGYAALTTGPGLRYTSGKIMLSLGAGLKTANDVLEVQDSDFGEYEKVNAAETKYATKEQVASLMNSGSTVQVVPETMMTSYYTKFASDAKYALKTDIPDVSSFITAAALDAYLPEDVAEATYAKKEDLSGLASSASVTDRLSRYALKDDIANFATTTQLQDSIASFATRSELEAATANVVKFSDIDTLASRAQVQAIVDEALAEYPDSFDLDAKLFNYPTASQLNTVLQGYVSNTDFDAALLGYASLADVTGLANSVDQKLVGYVTAAKLTDELSKYLKPSDLPPVNTIVTTDALATSLQPYAKSADVFTKAEVNAKLNTYYTKTEDDALRYTKDQVNTELAKYYTKTDADNRYYTKQLVDQSFSNYYTKVEVNSTFYSRTQIDTLLAGYYSKTQIDANNYTKTQSDGKYALKSDITAFVNSGQVDTQITTALTSYYNKADVDAKIAAQATKNQIIYTVGGAQVASPKEYLDNKNLTVAGSTTFILTSNGQTSGTALFANIIDVQMTANDASTTYALAWAISTDRKTLTITVNKSATPVLSLLGINILAAPTAAPVGTNVRVRVIGT